MTVSNLLTKVPYACDGTTVIFPITFVYFEDADIRVVLKNNTTKAETVLVLNTDFTIPAVGEEYYGNIILAGDYAVTPPASGYTLLLKRVLPLTQLLDYIEATSFPAEMHEEALDRRTMIEQQISEMLGRALLLAEASTLAGLVLPEKDGEKAYLGWNTAGTALEVKYGGEQGPQGEAGDPGANGADGLDAPEVMIEYSINGSTNWHETYASGDKYCRFSTDGGVTFTDAMKFIGDDGAGSGDFKADGTVPMTGNLDLGGNSLIFINPTANLTACGLIKTVTVDTNGVGVGAALCLSADGHFDEADADDPATLPCEAIALETGTGSKKVLLWGYIKNTSWSFTVGGALYVSGTQGTLTQTAPASNKYTHVRGVAVAADTIKFAPSRLVTQGQVTTIPFIIDGGGAAITTGVKGDLVVDFDGTIESWTLLGDTSGSIVVDIWMDTYANYPPTVADTITASAKPTISSATKGQSSTLTGWTTAIAAGKTLRFNVDSCTTITRCTIALKVRRS